MDVIDPASVLQELSVEEKITLLSGSDMWHTAPLARLNIPRVRVSDGPNGVRGTAWLNPHPSACFPCGTGLAACFDVDFATKVGVSLGQECRVRGTHCLLGPTTNIQRHPCGGRGFESFSEDPLLAGRIACAWIEGVQSQKVMTTPKHFIANEQEENRRSSDSVVDERTLHEIYLEPFRLQCQAKPLTFMTAYNRINGLHCSEHKSLLQEVLRRDFGFNGMIMSDWAGTYSTCESIQATMDLEMHGPSMMRGSPVERYILAGKLKPAEIDGCVLRILRFIEYAQKSGIPFEHTEGTIDDPNIRRLLRDAARRAVVLLKNDEQILPLNPLRGETYAVIGPNADAIRHAGGGSANVTISYGVSPLEAIEHVVLGAGGSVSFAQGVQSFRWLPLLTPFMIDSSGTKQTLLTEFFDVDPYLNIKATPLHTMELTRASALFVDGIPKTVPVRGYVRMRTLFTPNVSGLWTLGLAVAGQASLFLDGQVVVENLINQRPSVLFFNTASEETTGTVRLQAGRTYQLEVRFSNFQQISDASPYAGRRGAVRISGLAPYDVDEEINKAVDLARRCDKTILVIGTNDEWEAEAYDRDDMKLPANQDRLVSAVLEVAPSAIIVNQSGMPVETPWISKAPTFVHQFFGGNETGSGLADVLFGIYNPSSKLPISWGRKLEDYPSALSFRTGDRTVYTEGMMVGYRFFDRACGVPSQFAFGHGLSYTSFELSQLDVQQRDEYDYVVSIRVTNTGASFGGEVVQVYVQALESEVERSEIVLASFAAVQLGSRESKTISMNLERTGFSYYCVPSKRWILEQGRYDIRVGTSSVDLAVSQRIEIKRSASWLEIL